ncbi:MAG TPA: hypothetical protein VFI65_09535 [Streptosporangiaceae bacterium]|nr:hypothetical protein [Streptosporangiaceae bacterium]
MSDPFDPIEQWLSADVELMPPRAGAFDQVHRRARRRKAAVATMTAAGAAVVIAAAVTVPQLASALLPGHGGGGPDRVVPQTSSSQHSGPSPSRSGHPSPHRSSGSPSSPAGQLAILGSSVAPDARFEPTSITFVNDSVGAVLGRSTAGCPAGSAGPCTVVAGTTNYGQSWTKVDAPAAGPPSGSSGVSQVRFLNGDDGWAFGPELYATHSGGKTWTKITGLGGRVIDLSTIDLRAYAVVATCSGSGSDFAGGCTRFSLFSSAYNSDDWQPVRGVTNVTVKQPVRPGGLQLTGQYGYLLAGSTLFAGSPSGGSWQRVSPSSGPVPACLSGSGPSGVIAPGENSDLYLICQGTLYSSIDAGQTWQKSGPFTGEPTSLAVAPSSGTLVAATGAGIFYSTDQRTWKRAGTGSGPAGGFSFVGMTTTTRGVAIPADASLREILITGDGGLTWAAKAIS